MTIGKAKTGQHALKPRYQYYYRQKAQLAEDPVHETIFDELAREEYKHYVLMDNLCDLLRRTKTHIADAEMSHVADYVEGVYYYKSF
ncbi:hypothetical protein ACFL6U_01725 [Planctomycetota bacterium]